MTLFEVLIVVAILTLLSAGIAVAVLRQKGNADSNHARAQAGELRQLAKFWQIEHGASECPTVQRLLDDGVMERGGNTKDPWGKPYRMECSDAEVTVISDGKDKTPNTADDIRAPPPEAGEQT